MRIETLEQMQKIVRVALTAVYLDRTSSAVETDHLSIADGVVTITPAEVPIQTFGGTKFTMGWEVTWWTWTAGGPGYLDPPEYDEKELYVGPNPYEAAKTAVMALHQDRLDNALEYYGEQSEL